MTTSTLPTFNFNNVNPSTIINDIKQDIATLEAAANAAAKATPTWHGLMTELDDIEEVMHQRFGPFSHLHSVKNTPELRKAYEQCLALLSEHSSKMGQNLELYNAYHALNQSDAAASFNSAQQKLMHDTLQAFQLSGVDLPTDKKARFKAIQLELSQLCNQYENNVMDATDLWFLHVEDKTELAGLPDFALAGAAQKAQDKKLTGHVLGIDLPCYINVLTHCSHRPTREKIYEAFCTRASNAGPHDDKHDNSNTLLTIVARREEAAHLLGFNCFSEYSIANKMAPSCDKVIAFLTDLATRSQSKARDELKHMQAFAAKHDGLQKLEPWDVTFYNERIKATEYELSQETLRPYFPITTVLPGLFALVERVFGVRIIEQTLTDKWDDAVQYFEIHDDNGLRGAFYTDLYARAGKRSGAWMDEIATRYIKADGSLQLPVALLTCNFMPPSAEHPSCLTHDDMTTLFHEFGHTFHHLSSQVDYSGVSGINGVAWDAVELPSQFMENFCWEFEVLQNLSEHTETGNSLPKALFDKLERTRTFGTGMQMLRQVEFALFDFKLYSQKAPDTIEAVQALAEAVRQDVAVMHPPHYNRSTHNFTHIFSGGYAAGYYSYKWAEVLSADAYGRFQEDGIFNAATGAAFLHDILEKGGSAEPMELFKTFRGREPEVEALLKQDGIV